MTHSSDARMPDPTAKKPYQTPELVEEGRFLDLTQLDPVIGDEDNPYGAPGGDLS